MKHQLIHIGKALICITWDYSNIAYVTFWEFPVVKGEVKELTLEDFTFNEAMDATVTVASFCSKHGLTLGELKE